MEPLCDDDDDLIESSTPKHDPFDQLYNSAGRQATITEVDDYESGSSSGSDKEETDAGTKCK